MLRPPIASAFGNHHPAAVAENSVQAARMPGGEQPLEKLLADVDRGQAERGTEPQAQEPLARTGLRGREREAPAGGRVQPRPP